MKAVFAICFSIMLVLSIVPVLDANAIKGKGVYLTKYGTKTSSIVCGDKLCSELIRDGEANQQSRFAVGGVSQQNAMLAQPKLSESVKPSLPKSDPMKSTNLQNNDSKLLSTTSNYLKYALGHHMDSIVEVVQPTNFNTKDSQIIYTNTGKSDVFVGAVFYNTLPTESGDIFVNKNYMYPILSDYPTFLATNLQPGDFVAVSTKSSTLSGTYEVAIMKPVVEKIINGVIPFYPVPIAINHDDSASWEMRLKSLNADKNPPNVLIHLCSTTAYNKSCETTNLGNIFDEKLTFDVPKGGAIFAQSSLDKTVTAGVGGHGISRGEATIFFSERAGLTLATKG